MVFQKTILKPITTSLTARPSTAQIVIPNPLDQDIFVNGIELILNPEFSKKGKIVILINEVAVFDENDTEAMFGYAKFPIPLGKTLRRSNSIEVFAWNSVDTNIIDVKVNLSISSELQPFNSQAENLGRDIFNVVVTEEQILFPEIPRSIGNETILIDLKGNKKMIVTLGRSKLVDPAVYVEDTFGKTAAFWDPALDGNLLTKTGFVGTSLGSTRFVTIDFGSIKVREPRVKYTWNTSCNSGSGNHQILTSDTDSGYVNNATQGHGCTAGATQTIIGTSHSFRFMRFQAVDAYSMGSGMNTDVFEMFDNNVIGGTGALSFEVLNSVTNVWTEFISATEFGTISEGETDKVAQVGDVITISVSGNTYGLPSTQTAFRAKYTITGGGIQNSVTILKVS